jgi:hypothetical protein
MMANQLYLGHSKAAEFQAVGWQSDSWEWGAGRQLADFQLEAKAPKIRKRMSLELIESTEIQAE